MIVDRSKQTQDQSFGSFSGFGASNNALTVDDLLNVAKAQGGAVARVAEELTHPEVSMLSTMSEGLKRAFGGFVDVISAPNQIVAGMISSKHTIKQAVENNVNVSDVILGKESKSLSKTEKAGSFIARLAIDVLADPLTYVTFGASRGILGLSAAQKAISGTKTAERLGLKNIGDEFAISEDAEEIISYN